jgi:hypothetical protein
VVLPVDYWCWCVCTSFAVAHTVTGVVASRNCSIMILVWQQGARAALLASLVPKQWLQSGLHRGRTGFQSWLHSDSSLLTVVDACHTVCCLRCGQCTCLCVMLFRRSAKVPPNAQAPRKLAPEITAEALDGDPVCGEVSRLELVVILYYYMLLCSSCALALPKLQHAVVLLVHTVCACRLVAA